MAPRKMESAVGAEIVIDGRRYVNFGGSSYLGLASRPEIVECGVAMLRRYGSGFPMPLDQGVITEAHLEFEAAANDYFGSEASLYLGSGYHFGLVSMAALRCQFAAVFYDELAHYALREAIGASGLRSYPFKHLNADDLDGHLRRHLRAGERPLIATDGMFPALGEIAPLDALAQVAQRYEGRVIVDESHSFGVLGPLGRGAAEHYGLGGAVVLGGGSLGKAFGTCGGVIPAAAEDIAAFRATPAAIGASPGSPAATYMCATSLRYVRQHPELLQRLRANIAYAKLRLASIGLDVGNSATPVAAFVPGPHKAMRSLRDELMSEGVFVYHTRYIGAGDAGVMRCAIFADHTSEHIDRLVDALSRHL